MKATLTALLVLLLFVSTPLQARDYTFAVVPQQSASKIARLWGPILKRIGDETGLSLKLVTAKNIPTFEKRLAEGKYDFAYMNPYHFTTFSARSGYIAFARQRDKTIQGIVVVRRDSPVTSLEELADSMLAFPAPAAFAASILTQAEFFSREIPFKPRYVASHDSVYLAVAKGLSPAGGGVLRTLNNTKKSVQDQLRILWKTPRYTPHAFAAHPQVPERDREKLESALIALEQSEGGMALLRSINFKGIETAQSSDWDDVRSLNITLLDE